MLDFGWTSETLSEQIGMSATAMRRCRSGKANTNLKNLLKIFTVLGIGFKLTEAKHCREYGKRSSHERVKTADCRVVLVKKELKDSYFFLPPKKNIEYSDLIQKGCLDRVSKNQRRVDP
jgi:hypothetical protein